MDRHAMDELIDRHWEAENSGDLDAAMATLHPDVYHDVVGSPIHPLRGRAAVRAFYADLHENLQGESREPLVPRRYGRNFCVEDVLNRAVVSGTMLGVAGHGRTVTFRILHVWEFADGLISRENVWLDTNAIHQQLTT
ncbi:nuclear transport factor 2 family protein [Sinomonas sp. P47F7]|uniref:nuclear transport factor 2 family protein n=1 Tax=Sinomonas sp. P47F7 TaxID=3410987 RepID=UPI003BF53F63